MTEVENRFPPLEPLPPVTPYQTVRAVLRIIGILTVTLGLLPIFLILRALPGWKERRIAMLWGHLVAPLCGIRILQEGRPMTTRGALVANHVSWLDIVTLAATAPIFFVSKAEIASWPGVGALARICNTEFIERKPSRAKEQEQTLGARLVAGDLLCFFPEGTSTDGASVLPFKTALFAIFHRDESAEYAQPVTLVYRPDPALNLPERLYGFFDDMAFGPHLWAVLTRSRKGRAHVIFHPPARARDFPDRKALAAHCEALVRNAHKRVTDQAPGMDRPENSG